MTDYLLLFFATIFFYEIISILNLKKNIKQNIIFYKKIINLINLKKVSDFRKEKLTFYYSRNLLFSSIKCLFACFCIILLILLLSKFSNSFFNLVLSINGFIEFFIIYIIYHKLKKQKNAKL